MKKFKIPLIEIPELSVEMVRFCVISSLGFSGFTSLLSAAIHVRMGVHFMVPAVEFLQFVAELCLWMYAVKTEKWRLVFPLQMVGAFAGMSTVVLIGGSNFLTNCFWLAIIGPVAIICGYVRLGISFFICSLGLIWMYFNLHSPNESSPEAIFAVDAILYTFSMMVFALIIKHWQNTIQKKIDGERSRNVDLERQKHEHLVSLNHELRNPIMAIGMASDLLAKSNLVIPQRDRYLLKTIHSTSSHVIELLNDVLEVERLESGAVKFKSQPFSVRKLVHEVADISMVAAYGLGNVFRIRVETEMADDWVGPSPRIRQILLNLTANAAKHAPSAEVLISVFQEGRSLVFEISDNGPGMSKQALKHLYQPYSSSLGSNGTSGLGLWICKLIAETHLGGTISANSTPSGTTFTVKLPLEKHSTQPQWEYSQPNEVDDQQVRTSESSPKILEGKRILLVDDDQINLELIELVLAEIGMVVESSTSAQAALSIVASGHRFDFALVDQNLGGGSVKDGVELTADLVAAGVPMVVGHTGNYSQGLQKRWSKVGVFCVIRKPASATEIIRTLASKSVVSQ